MEELLKAISQVGFPIAVAVYLLMRIEPKLLAMTDCIKDLTAIVKADTENSKETRQTIATFALSVNDLKNEMRRFNDNNTKAKS